MKYTDWSGKKQPEHFAGRSFAGGCFCTGKEIFPYYGDLADSARLYNLINEIKPDEIYHFAGKPAARGFELPNTPATLTHSAPSGCWRRSEEQASRQNSAMRPVLRCSAPHPLLTTRTQLSVREAHRGC